MRYYAGRHDDCPIDTPHEHPGNPETNANLPVSRSIDLTELFANKGAAVTVDRLDVEDVGEMFCIEVWVTVGTDGQDIRLIWLYVDRDQLESMKVPS